MYNRFTQLLESCNVTAAQVAQDTGIFASTFSDWKKGKSSPKIEKLQKIAAFFNVPLNFLIGKSPFDVWEDIQNDRQALLDYMYLPLEVKEILLGEQDINMLSLVEYIRFIDTNIESIRLSADGDFDIVLKGWASRLRQNAKKLSSDKMESKIFLVDNLVPVLGPVPSSASILAEENITSFEFANVANTDEYFYLTAIDESMKGAQINVGSQVLVRKQDSAEDGQIVVCRINGGDLTLKRFKQKGSTILLLAENPEFEPVIISDKEFANGHVQIYGVAKKVLNDL